MDSQALARLLYLISHEVRSPLGVVRGYLRMVDQRDGELSESNRQAIAAALRASDRAAEIMARVSALAQIHRGDLPVARQPLSLADLLRDVSRAIVVPTDPVVRVSLGELADLTMEGDPELMRAAVSSLITAVVRAQARDTVVVVTVMRTPSADQPTARVEIVVETAQRRAASEAPLDIGRGGMGIELPIAAAIVDAHGGRIGELRDADGLVGMVVWVPI